MDGYDYAQAGAYFVTMVAHRRVCLFGEVVNGEMQENQYGHIVTQCWEWLAMQYPYVILDAFVVLPNHCHGI